MDDSAEIKQSCGCGHLGQVPLACVLALALCHWLLLLVPQLSLVVMKTLEGHSVLMTAVDSC